MAKINCAPYWLFTQNSSPLYQTLIEVNNKINEVEACVTRYRHSQSLILVV